MVKANLGLVINDLEYKIENLDIDCNEKDNILADLQFFVDFSNAIFNSFYGYPYRAEERIKFHDDYMLNDELKESTEKWVFLCQSDKTKPKFVPASNGKQALDIFVNCMKDSRTEISVAWTWDEHGNIVACKPDIHETLKGE